MYHENPLNRLSHSLLGASWQKSVSSAFEKGPRFNYKDISSFDGSSSQAS
jgi:hypothetical protein